MVPSGIVLVKESARTVDLISTDQMFSGFWHEQSRADRDDYVTINWDNIPKDKHHNFLKYNYKETDDLNRPYDYGSVMHYGMDYLYYQNYYPFTKFNYILITY